MTQPPSVPPQPFPLLPKLGERIRVEGHERSFFVARVDEDRQEVDLVPVTGASPCLEAVPFVRLRRSSAS